MLKSSTYSVLKAFFYPKIRFAVASLLATVVDFCLFSFVLISLFEPVNAERISAGVGMVINFILQKRYVFKMKRNALLVLMLSIALSVIAIEIGAQLINVLTHHEVAFRVAGYSVFRIVNPFYNFFLENIVLAKILSVLVKFVFNFYTKRWAFQKEFISLKKYKNNKF